VLMYEEYTARQFRLSRSLRPLRACVWQGSLAGGIKQLCCLNS